MKHWIALLGAASVAAALVWTLVPAWTGWPAGQPAGDEGTQQLQARSPTGSPAAEIALAGATYDELTRHLERQPRDGRALVFKARLDMQAQRFDLAAAGYEAALKQTPNVARDPGVWVEYAEARAMTQGGKLVGEPEKLLDEALRLDSSHALALDLAGSAAWEKGDYALTVTYWTLLLEQTPTTSPRHAALRTAIEQAEQRARVSLPPKR